MRVTRVSVHPVVALAAVALIASCGGEGVPDAADPSADAGAAPDAADWGPLAVVETGSGDREALISGTLQIDESCALLDERGNPVLLVWPAERTTWDADARTVTLTTSDGGTVMLRDGSETSFGGGGSDVAEGGPAAEEFLASTEWVSPPDPGCVTDSRWFVTEAVTGL